MKHASAVVFVLAWLALLVIPKSAPAVELVRVLSSVDAATTVKTVSTSDRGIVSFRRDGTNLVVGTILDGVLPDGVDVDALSVVDGGRLVFSTSVSFESGGVAADDEDLLLLEGTSISLFLDGSFYGLPESADIDAVHVASLDPIDLYYSVDAPVKMGSVVFADDDIVRLNGATHTVVRTGASLLGGAAPRADVDALAVDPSGSQYLVSVDVPMDEEPGRTAAEAGDLVLWANDSLLMYFDASSSGLTAAGLDLDAVAVEFAFFSDDFETGDTSRWSSTTP
jgi:hypothetical protein